tara:strand:- start:101 stop:523 length:423 start_codon:yes stop_codon:yes gene_type:complete
MENISDLDDKNKGMKMSFFGENVNQTKNTIEKELHEMKSKIEMMSHHNQLEILQLLVQSRCDMSENQNGTFLNLSKLDGHVIEKIREYLSYVEFQNEYLKEIERKKDALVRKYFILDNNKSNATEMTREGSSLNVGAGAH